MNRTSLLRVVGLLGGWILGAVLLLAAWGKALDPVAFAEEIRTQGLEILLSAPALAVLFVGVEAALGVALLIGLRGRWILAPTTAMVALFVFLTGRAYWRFSQGLIDASDACGCFGSLVTRTPAEAFWQDLLLLVPPLVMIYLTPRRVGSGSLRSARWLLAGVFGVAGMVFTHLAPGLPLDDLATRLKPGARVSELCAGSDSGDSVRICLDALTPELEEGDHLLVVSAIDDPGLIERLDDLNDLTSDPDAARIWLLTWSTEEELGPFFWQYGPAFEIREVPEALLASLYRTAPRTFFVLDGEVRATYSGIPDGEALMAASRAETG